MAPRKLKTRRQGCWIEATGSGLLRLRFRWRIPTATGLHKFSETTTLRDTPENRAALLKQAAIIGAEIAANRFDYLYWFPNGSRAAYFRRRPLSPQSLEPDAAPTIGQYYPGLGRSKGATDSPPFKGARLSQSFPHVHPSLPRRRGLAGFSARASRRTQGAASDRPSSGNQDRKKRYRRFHARDGA